MQADWYTINNIDEIDSPALVIYPERVKENIRILKTFVPDLNRLRPHIKTNKSPEVVRLMIDSGISKFKCATIAEAEMLAMEGAADVLLAYQPVGPKGKRFAELSKKFSNIRFSCLVDNERTAQQLSDVGKKYGPINVFVDLNVGMNRTGIAPTDALDLCLKIAKMDDLTFAGLHAYDGHLRDAELEIRTKKVNQAFEAVEKLQTDILKATGQTPVIVAGGTPTFPVHANRKGEECSPGTFIFWDKGYQQILPEQPFVFGALVITRVVSKPTEETVCVDLGHKSIASENPLASRVYFLNAGNLEPVGHSEEHMVFKVKGNNTYQVGDVLYGVPHHICPTVALHDMGYVVEKGLVKESWNIVARKRKLTV